MAIGLPDCCQEIMSSSTVWVAHSATVTRHVRHGISRSALITLQRTTKSSTAPIACSDDSRSIRHATSETRSAPPMCKFVNEKLATRPRYRKLCKALERFGARSVESASAETPPAQALQKDQDRGPAPRGRFRFRDKRFYHSKAGTISAVRQLINRLRERSPVFPYRCVV